MESNQICSTSESQRNDNEREDKERETKEYTIQNIQIKVKKHKRNSGLIYANLKYLKKHASILIQNLAAFG